MKTSWKMRSCYEDVFKTSSRRSGDQQIFAWIYLRQTHYFQLVTLFTRYFKLVYRLETCNFVSKVVAKNYPRKLSENLEKAILYGKTSVLGSVFNKIARIDSKLYQAKASTKLFFSARSNVNSLFGKTNFFKTILLQTLSMMNSVTLKNEGFYLYWNKLLYRCSFALSWVLPRLKFLLEEKFRNRNKTNLMHR